MSDRRKIIRATLIDAIKKQPLVCCFGEFAPTNADGDDDYDADPLIGIDGQVDFNALADAIMAISFDPTEDE